MSPDAQGERNDTLVLLRFFALVIQAASTSVEVFVREGFGFRYLGNQAGLVFLLIPAYCFLFEFRACAPFLWFFLAYTAALALHRVGRFRRGRRGEAEGHSRYTGRPLLWRLAPYCPESFAKRVVEPLLVGCVGLAVFPSWPPFGLYLWLAAGAMGACDLLCDRREELRALDLNDLVIEQEMSAERFRRIRGERW